MSYVFMARRVAMDLVMCPSAADGHGDSGCPDREEAPAPDRRQVGPYTRTLPGASRWSPASRNAVAGRWRATAQWPDAAADRPDVRVHASFLVAMKEFVGEDDSERSLLAHVHGL